MSLKPNFGIPPSKNNRRFKIIDAKNSYQLSSVNFGYLYFMRAVIKLGLVNEQEAFKDDVR